VQTLIRARRRVPANSRIALFLAKLYFKDDLKMKAVEVCESVIADLEDADADAATATATADTSPADSSARLQLSTSSAQDVADAFYIIGWIQIHAGDHTRG